MIGSYLIIFWRNLVKAKTLSFINVAGLAVGMTFIILIGLWVRSEITFDNFHSNGDRIVMIMKNSESNGERTTGASVPLPLYDELKNSYPEIENITRLDWGGIHNLAVNERKFMRFGHYADPGFLKMFSFDILSGNGEAMLNAPASIVLTRSLAQLLFGHDDPLGKAVRLDNKHELLVTGVLGDIPHNSSLQFDFLIPYEFNVLSDPSVLSRRAWWGDNFLRNIVELRKGTSLEEFSSRIKTIIRDVRDDNKEGYLFIHPLRKWHLYDDFKEWVNVGGRIEYVNLFAFIGVFILLIACINFMNLATARSEKRIKEVGIRKAIGSGRFQLAGQFLTESILTVFISLIISMVLANLLIPFMKDLGLKSVSINNAFLNEGVWFPVILLGACIVTGLLAGSYPAIYLSSFIPIRALKGVVRAGQGVITTRKFLVVTQFTLSIMLMIATIVVYRQIEHAKSRPLGYDPQNIMSIGVTEDLKKNFSALKLDLMNLGFIESVSKMSSPMTDIYSAWTDFSWAGKDPNTDILLSVIMTEYDYEKTTKIKLLQGRSFSRLFASDSNAVMINESALKIMGFKDPIGETIDFGDQKLKVIGVVADVVMTDPFDPVRPAIYLFNPDRVGDIALRLKHNTDVHSAIASIQSIVEKYNPAYPFEYKFVEDEFEKKFVFEAQVGRLAGVFACLAIFISCLGLFGLVAFMAEQRVKEIGVRKILGASVIHLWNLMSASFIYLVLLSFAIATPLAFMFLESWLEKYSYRTSLSWWVFGVAGIGALLVTLITVSFQAIKAAMANPVRSLRSE
jgi:putative ABC transport system permease protein